jgi:hypothetical protein
MPTEKRKAASIEQRHYLLRYAVEPVQVCARPKLVNIRHKKKHPRVVRL